EYSHEHIAQLRRFFIQRQDNLAAIVAGFPDVVTLESDDDDLVTHWHQEVMRQFLTEAYVNQRNTLQRWASVTRQTPFIDTDYLDQHLVSLFAGVEGMGTAARGDDLSDGSEVKSCTRADQLGTCKQCGSKVMALDLLTSAERAKSVVGSQY